MDPDQTPAGYVVATYEEIRERWRLGSTDAARIKAKRRKWLHEPPNHPGAVARIRVPQEDWNAAERWERSPGSDSEQSRSFKGLASVAAIFREERDRLQAERDRVVIERDAVQAEVTKLREEREEARVRAAQAEAEARGLREALTEARRPFWRRWLN